MPRHMLADANHQNYQLNPMGQIYCPLSVTQKDPVRSRPKLFESQLVADNCMLMGTQKIQTSPHHPQNNGQCERFNSTLISKLGTLLPEKKLRVEKPHWNIGSCLQLHPKHSYGVQPLLSHEQKTTPPTNRCYTGPNTPNHYSIKYI